MKFNLLHIWASMGLMSKLVAFALAAMAVASIGIVVERLLGLAKQDKETRAFTTEARPLLDAWDMSGIVALAAKHPISGLARLVRAGMGRFLRAREDERGNVPPIELARREIARQKEAVSANLRRGLSLLATVGSVAPFVGLLGTVVGIISAFQSIGATGSGGLGAVSTGIAEALIVTAFGLAVAIPAVLCFNYLSTRINAVEAALDRSMGELTDEMENAADRVSGEHASKAA